ncbi:unnamed protein product [Calypogeia fissa]
MLGRGFSPELFVIPNEARETRGGGIAVVAEEPDRGEDVCFICFDGGELVVCDQRSCPKAYHRRCIGRDKAFFETGGAWICRRHFCSICTQPANFQCYTCPTAYCSGCLDQAHFHRIRHRNGLCAECWPIVRKIEHNAIANLDDTVEVDFSDQETYEGLFKKYWEAVKQRWTHDPVELGDDELNKDGNGAVIVATSNGSEEGQVDVIVAVPEEKIDAEEHIYELGNEEEDMEARDVPKRKKRRRSKAKSLWAEGVDGDPEARFGSEEDDDAIGLVEEDAVERDDGAQGLAFPEAGFEDADDDAVGPGQEDANDHDDGEDPDVGPREFDGWASKELIEFVKYMNGDPEKPLSRFQVTKMLWSYIKRHKLQDPRKKTQILCDDKLQTIFGKTTLGQFEMFQHLQKTIATIPNGLDV